MKLEKADFKSSIGENHHVCYYLYPSKIDNVDKFGIPKNIAKRNDKYIIKHGNGICFARLLGEFEQNKGKIDRLVYLLQNNNTPITQDEVHKWLGMCIKAKALPDYIRRESDIEHNRYILKLDPAMKPSILFIRLTCIRWIQEAPIFIKNIVVLVNKYHMSFYLAWLVASRMSIGNSWHNIVSNCAQYGQSIEKILKDSTYDVAAARGIKNLLVYPNRFDKRSINNIGKRLEFLATDKVLTAMPKLGPKSVVHIKHITNSALNEAVESGSNNDIKSALKEING